MFQQFRDNKEGVKALVAITKGKMCKSLKKFIKDNVVSSEIQQSLMVEDAKLASKIKKKFDDIDVVQSTDKMQDIFRMLRANIFN
jgi:hypothetical protein